MRPREIAVELRARAGRARRRLNWVLSWAPGLARGLIPSPLRDPAVTRAYGRYLAGKRVALVGPAPTIEGSRQRDLIDSHDVVARVNHALPVPAHLQPDVGCRTDVLYHNLWHGSPKAQPFPELVALLDGHVQWVCSAYPYLNLDHPFADQIDRFVKDLAGRVPFRVPSNPRYLRTWWDCRTRPNAGVSAIADLLSFDIARLYLTGFTFYAGAQAYHAGYRGIGSGPFHDQDRQRAFVARTLRTDARLVADEVLGQILARSSPASPRASTGDEQP
jgi:hypothetical protein